MPRSRGRTSHSDTLTDRVAGEGNRVVRKKWRIPRTMVVPANWQGSVEHFYHFILGYFMPLILWQERSGTMAFTVRDCGPMNPWFSLVRPGTDLDYMPPGVMLERAMTHRQEMQILRGWDDPTRFHRASFDLFSKAVLARVVAAPDTASAPQRRITVLDRRPSPDFYVGADSETHGSGADWRSLPNTSTIADALSALGDVAIVDSAALSPREQVEVLAGTNLVVAQHGAGLSNMVWMPPGSAVLEIRPPLIPTINEIFANLASCRDFDYLAVDQEDEHSQVDPASVLAAAERLVSSPGAFVPPMPGRLPMRVLRQLPRRL
jgi:hypothetical protein